MATAPPVQTRALPYAEIGLSHWLGCTASPRQEARALFAMIGRNGDTVESIRELIAVPPRIEHLLRLYLRQHPEDSDGVERALEFRRRVSEEFELLTACRKRAPVTCSFMTLESPDLANIEICSRANASSFRSSEQTEGDYAFHTEGW